MKKAIKFTVAAMSILAIGAVGAIGWHFYTPAPQSLPVTAVESKYIYNISDKCETVGASDYVFVGTVEKFEGYEYQNDLPYTVYSVFVKQDLKGTLPADTPVTVKKIGGMDQLKRSMVVVDGDDSFPEEGQDCIFAVCVDTDGTLVASSPNRVISLDDDSVIAEYQDAVENEVQNEYVEKMWEIRNHTYGLAAAAAE